MKIIIDMSTTDALRRTRRRVINRSPRQGQGRPVGLNVAPIAQRAAGGWRRSFDRETRQLEGNPACHVLWAVPGSFARAAEAQKSAVRTDYTGAQNLP